MRYSNKEFVPVKPQGIFGDRKNDGFIKSLGKYYQVYSPEDPLHSEYETIKKLVKDFSGLYSYWHSQVVPIKEFFYVVNDKYQGDYPTLHPELQKIETNHTGVKCYPFFSSHLEDVFLKLDRGEIMELVGGLLLPEELDLFDVSVMNEVISYLLNKETDSDNESFPSNPDFHRKIKFNGLTSGVESLLKFGSYQEGSLKDFFKLNSNFAKDDLRNKFNQLYKEAMIKVDISDDKADLVFFYILNSASPSKKTSVRNSVLVLMSYYFSYCDIFEEPI